MSLSLFYCPVCGAANEPDRSICFACKQPFTPPLTTYGHIPLLLERYQVLTQVGAGGFGVVYKARDRQAQDCLVAVKQINVRGLSQQEVIDATDGFNREVQILSRLSHPHLPRIHTHGTDPEHWYVVMDFIEGETLEAYLHDPAAPQGSIRALKLDEVLNIGLQLCDVLSYLHAHQPPIIFRDLKPANVMRTKHGQLYLIDFGIARFFKPGQTRDTSPLGSPGYAAPEQYGRAQTTPQTDIYSLGALLYCLISGDDPSNHAFQFPPLKLSHMDGVRELDALIQYMISPKREQRPVSMLEVRGALQRLQTIHIQVNRSPIWTPASARLLLFSRQASSSCLPCFFQMLLGKQRAAHSSLQVA